MFSGAASGPHSASAPQLLVQGPPLPTGVQKAAPKPQNPLCELQHAPYITRYEQRVYMAFVVRTFEQGISAVQEPTGRLVALVGVESCAATKYGVKSTPAAMKIALNDRGLCMIAISTHRSPVLSASFCTPMSIILSAGHQTTQYASFVGSAKLRLRSVRQESGRHSRPMA